MKFISNSVLLFIRDLGGLAPGPFMLQALEADLIHTPSTDPSTDHLIDRSGSNKSILKKEQQNQNAHYLI